MFLKVRIWNSLCSFQIIQIVLEVSKNVPPTFQDFTTGKLALKTCCYNVTLTSYQWLYQHWTLNILLRCCKSTHTKRGQVCDVLIAEVLSDLPVPLISIPPTDVPSLNRHIDKYVYDIFGFANKYVENNGVILIFHDDDPRIFKDIKSFLKTNGYEIHFKYAIINSLLWMNIGIKGKMVILLLDFIYITFDLIPKNYIRLSLIVPNFADLT